MLVSKKNEIDWKFERNWKNYTDWKICVESWMERSEKKIYCMKDFYWIMNGKNVIWILKKFKSSFRNHFSQIKALTFNFDEGCVWFANLIEMVNLSITNYFTVILFISEGVLLCVESHIENNRSIYSKGIDFFAFL